MNMNVYERVFTCTYLLFILKINKISFNQRRMTQLQLFQYRDQRNVTTYVTTSFVARTL